jgi:hypothetical protein
MAVHLLNCHLKGSQNDISWRIFPPPQRKCVMRKEHEKRRKLIYCCSECEAVLHLHRCFKKPDFIVLQILFLSYIWRGESACSSGIPIHQLVKTEILYHHKHIHCHSSKKIKLIKMTNTPFPVMDYLHFYLPLTCLFTT